MSIIQCPHCFDYIIIEQINCQIFRHAVYKDTAMGQLPPHSSEEECKKAFENGSIYGCAKPFKYDGEIVSICGYI